MKLNKIMIIVHADDHAGVYCERLSYFLKTVKAEVCLYSVTKPLPAMMKFALGQDTFEQLQASYHEEAEQVFEKVRSHFNIDDTKFSGVTLGPDTDNALLFKIIETERVDCVVMPGRYDSKHARLSREDKHFLRTCPVPVWLLQKVNRERDCKVLGAVDVPSHHDKPESLNRDIIRSAMQFAEVFATEPGLVNVYPKMPDDIIEQHENEIIEDYVKRIRKHQQEPLNTLAGDFNFAHHQVHFKEGDADYEISHLVENEAYDILVLGTVGRVGLDKFLYGSIAEKLIEHVSCDILALKPKSQ